MFKQHSVLLSSFKIFCGGTPVGWEFYQLLQMAGDKAKRNLLTMITVDSANQLSVVWGSNGDTQWDLTNSKHETKRAASTWSSPLLICYMFLLFFIIKISLFLRNRSAL
jgi:hypothetical protein